MLSAPARAGHIRTYLMGILAKRSVLNMRAIRARDPECDWGGPGGSCLASHAHIRADARGGGAMLQARQTAAYARRHRPTPHRRRGRWQWRRRRRSAGTRKSMSAFERPPVAPEEAWVQKGSCKGHTPHCYCVHCLPYPAGGGKPLLNTVARRLDAANPEVYVVDTGEYIAMPPNFADHEHRFVGPSGHAVMWRHPPQQLLRRFGRNMRDTTRCVNSSTDRDVARSVCYPCTDVGPPPA